MSKESIIKESVKDGGYLSALQRGFINAGAGAPARIGLRISTRMNTTLTILALLVTTAFAAQAQILLSSGTSYQQDFNTLAAPPKTNATWADNKTLPGWYAARETGTNAPHFRSYRVASGDLKKGWIYSFGSEANSGRNPASDRAFGSIATASTGTIAFGVRFQNDTRQTMTNFIVAYTGEQWRNEGNERPQALVFSYRVSKSVLTNPEPGVLEGWSFLAALDFKSAHDRSEEPQLDGNLAASRAAKAGIVLPGVALQPGEELFLRWSDVNDNGPDDGLALDDFSLTWSPVAGR